jgi:hypothetical protein
MNDAERPGAEFDTEIPGTGTALPGLDAADERNTDRDDDEEPVIPRDDVGAGRHDLLDDDDIDLDDTLEWGDRDGPHPS